MSDLTAPFEQPGFFAVPLLQPIQGQASVCALRVGAMPEEFLFQGLPPRTRSSIAVAFSVWHAMIDLVAETDAETDDEEETNDVVAMAAHHSLRELGEVQPFVTRTEQTLRPLWPYEFMLTDQFISGDNKRAFFACYPIMGPFPEMVPDNQIGLVRMVANVPSAVSRINIDSTSPFLMSQHQMMQIMSMQPASPPALAIIPGGAGNMLFDYAYIDFGSLSPEDQKRTHAS